MQNTSRCAAIVAITLVALGACANRNWNTAVMPSGRPQIVQDRLKSLAPRLATDCGHARLGPTQTVVDCVENAIRSNAPVIASFQQRGSDSILVQGFATRSPGRFVTVNYDSYGMVTDPNGKGSVVSEPRDCVDPKITANDRRATVVCN
jgi:hypothetical protein